MKKIFGLVLAMFLFGNVFAQDNDSNTENTDTTNTEAEAEAEIEIPIELEDVEFNGFIPAAKKCEEWNKKTGVCIEWDERYAKSEAARLGKKIEQGTIGFEDIPVFLVKAIDFLTKLVGTVALLFMIYGGFQLMTNQKDDGKTTIKYAIAGVFVAFLSWLVVNIIKTQFTGVDFYGNRVEQAEQVNN